MRRLGILSLAVAVGGCSFIQSWGDLRDGEGMDAGPPTDAGDRVDAETDCNDCDAEGCGAGSPECVFDADSVCFVCQVGTGDEGADCFDDVDCNAGLICELGFCLIDCMATGGDCSGSDIGGTCGIPDTDPTRRVCVNHDCDPFGMECDVDEACAPLADGSNPMNDIATFCAYADSVVNAGEACTPGRPDRFEPERCEDGHSCVPLPGQPMLGECRRRCDVNDPTNCTGDEVCMPLMGMGGMTPTYFGSPIGHCVPDSGGCSPMCPVGQYCTGDMCSLCDPADPTTCPADEMCVDPETDGRFECLPRAECTGDAECTLGPMSRCIAGLCWYGCMSDGDCNAVGLSRCVRHATMPAPNRAVCVIDCSGGSCNDGSACVDFDGDSIAECRMR